MVYLCGGAAGSGKAVGWLKQRPRNADTHSMGEVDLSLAYAASAAYERAEENWVFIADALDELRPRVGLGDEEYAEVMEQFALVVDTNRTAPAVMRIMALAHRARIAAQLAGDRARSATRRPQSCWHRPRLRSTP